MTDNNKQKDETKQQNKEHPRPKLKPRDVSSIRPGIFQVNRDTWKKTLMFK